MNADQLMGLVRALLAASGPLAALLVQIGLPEEKAQAWLAIGSGFLTILTPLVAAWWSARAHSDAAKISAVAAMPGVEVTVNPTVAPAAAVAAANDPRQSKVGTSIMALITLGALLFGAGLGIAACTTAPDGSRKLDPAKVQQAEATAELIYTGAKIGVTVFCASSPSVPPCDSPSAMAEVTKAEGVLDAAFAGTKRAIAAAQTEEQLGTILVGLQEAALLYARVWATYGVSRGGG